MRLACIVLTKDEEERIEECLKHIRPYVDYLLVLDGESKDQTIEIAKKYANRVYIKPYSGSFAEEKNNARKLVPKDCLWILWVDADERFDPGFLKRMKRDIEADKRIVCIRFPRINLLDAKNWPDYQVRLTRNSRDIEWRGKVHERLYYKPDNTPLDHLDDESRPLEKRMSIPTAWSYPIIHLPRRQDLKRPWW